MELAPASVVHLSVLKVLQVMVHRWLHSLVVPWVALEVAWVRMVPRPAASVASHQLHCPMVVWEVVASAVEPHSVVAYHSVVVAPSEV